MNIAITTRGYKAPERLKNYVNEKLIRLERFSDIIMSNEAIISYEKLDQVVEFKVKLKHKVIRVKEKSEDVFKSVDLAIDNVERQIAKAKDRMKDRSTTKIVENLEQ
ncbi:MAG: ribosome-associated translation inhibitor RaiA [Calditrichaeota bacterium]|nr:MAG: ribosome-associated translation inhibitor RaiA [Calditrichota bacterium]MBL1207122.1 ribosome-associated translation inhibitor RaiA [Calditrichota bacterium]NOG46952.1 ribosome-associated translation inhibitor RaiA [Calditrichota bacterium]